MAEISEALIRERAYQIWEREGRPHGCEFEHWVRAQVELEAEAQTLRSRKPRRPRLAVSGSRPRAAARPSAGSTRRKKKGA